jgi:hypothetical protein
MTMMIAKVKGISRQQLLGDLHGDQSQILTNGMHLFKRRGKGCDERILKDIYFGLSLGIEFCVAITRIE